MMRFYQNWNNSIAAHFFRPEMAGRTVYLYVTEELIEELGQASGAGLQDFIKAVKTGLVRGERKGICQKALHSLEYWRHNRKYSHNPYPLYIGSLALFVLASGIDGDFSSNEYYRRLRTLLGEESKSGTYYKFDGMRVLWDDLEHWANEDKSGELGFFNGNIVGKRIHVGLPLAQTLLTQEELKALPVIFAEADLDPTCPPSFAALAQSLAKYGRNYLQKRTLRLLEEGGDQDELRLALLERIIDELRDWDGTASLSSDEETRIYGVLRLCCSKLDKTAGRTTLTLRCSTKHEFPEDGLSLILDGTSYSFYCEEDRIGWSEPIRSESDGKTIDASRFDWSQELQMQSPDKRWRFNLPAFPIRVFVTGEGEGLPGLIEVRQLPKNSRFYLAARQECCQLLKTWGESSCKGFKKLQIAEGLPRGWHFFYADAAYSDELFKREYPILSWPTTVRLDLQGGIRFDKGNRFFKFAPPKLVLQGGNESVKVYCNNQLLDCTAGEGVYELPGDAPPGTRLLIEARIGEEAIGRLSLSLVEDFSLPNQRDTQKFDSFGYSQTNLDPKQRGIPGAL